MNERRRHPTRDGRTDGHHRRDATARPRASRADDAHARTRAHAHTKTKHNKNAHRLRTARTTTHDTRFTIHDSRFTTHHQSQGYTHTTARGTRTPARAKSPKNPPIEVEVEIENDDSSRRRLDDRRRLLSTMSVVGFDFGNANNVVALARRKGIDVVLNDESKRETPSMVNFGEKQVRARRRRRRCAMRDGRWAGVR